MEYYLAIKNREILSFATTWVDLQVIMLLGQAGKILYVITDTWNPQIINVGEGVEEREPSYTVGGNAN